MSQMLETSPRFHLFICFLLFIRDPLPSSLTLISVQFFRQSCWVTISMVTQIMTAANACRLNVWSVKHLIIVTRKRAHCRKIGLLKLGLCAFCWVHFAVVAHSEPCGSCKKWVYHSAVGQMTRSAGVTRSTWCISDAVVPLDSQV